MKLFFINYFWEGNFPTYIADAFEQIGEKKFVCNISPYNHWLKKLHLQQIVQVKSFLDHKSLANSNEQVVKAIRQEKPDVLFSFNNSRLFPQTVKYIRDTLKCKTVCVVADNPFDSSRNRHFGMCLQYFNLILVGEKMWIPNIRRVAPNSRIEFVLGGFDPDIFKPISFDQLTENDKKVFTCDISFTGSSYGRQAEGNYRAGILGSLNEYKVKIWGDTGWKYREKYYPSLAPAYQGPRLSYEQLLKLFTLSSINLNMPSPQTLTSFQPRVFEIAAAKGFQIIDYREDLKLCYKEDEMVTFQTIPELKEKIKYYLNNKSEREKFADKMYQRTVHQYSWLQRVKEYKELIDS